MNHDSNKSERRKVQTLKKTTTPASSVKIAILAYTNTCSNGGRMLRKKLTKLKKKKVQIENE